VGGVVGVAWLLLASGAAAQPAPGVPTGATPEACIAGSDAACVDLGWRLLTGKGVKQDIGEGERLVGLSCGRGGGTACKLMGAWKASAPLNPKPDLAAAEGFAEKACKLGDHEGCMVLGMVRVQRGRFKEGLDALLVGCAYKLPEACYQAGLLYSRGTAAGIPQDARRALPLLEKACRAGHGHACHEVGIIWREGRIGVDLEKSAAYYIKACDLGSAHACGDAGNRLAEGRGVAKDVARGIELMTRGCDDGAPYACWLLARYYTTGIGVKPDVDTTLKLLATACDGGVGLACKDLSQAMLIPGMAATFPDPDADRKILALAQVHLTQECHEGHEGRSCKWLGLLKQKGRLPSAGPQEVKRLFKIACTYDLRMCEPGAQ